MNVSITIKDKIFTAFLTKPIDISIPLRDGMGNPNCFYAPPVSFEPLRAGNFVGSTAVGASVNFYNVQFNPHGNGTHTECVGHISKGGEKVNKTLQQTHFLTNLITFFPQKMENGDRIIDLEQVKKAFKAMQMKGIPKPEALVVRTMPNDGLKLTTNYSGANPPYFEAAAIEWLVAQGVQHLLTDLPSLDREEDGGALAAHKVFWKFDGEKASEDRQHASITEMVYVPNDVKDGLYLLNLQVANFELDAAPSRPVLYELKL